MIKKKFIFLLKLFLNFFITINLTLYSQCVYFYFSNKKIQKTMMKKLVFIHYLINNLNFLLYKKIHINNKKIKTK